jgi:hypothetical protein
MPEEVDPRHGISAVSRTAHECRTAANELAKLNGLVHKLQLRESRANHNRENTERKLKLMDEHKEKREKVAADLGERHEEYRQLRETKAARAREQREQVWEAGKKAAISVRLDREMTAKRLREYKDSLDGEVHKQEAARVAYYKDQRLQAAGLHKQKQEEDRLRRTQMASDMKEGRARTLKKIQDLHAAEDNEKKARVARQKDERHSEELTLEMRRQARETKLLNLSMTNTTAANYITTTVLNPTNSAVALARKTHKEALQRMEEAAKAEKLSQDKLQARVRSRPQGTKFRLSQKVEINISYANV